MRTSGLAEPMTGGASVRVEAVSHRFEHVSVLDSLSLEARANEIVALVGPSGCGKSTLLQLVAGLATPSEGEIAVAPPGAGGLASSARRAGTGGAAREPEARERGGAHPDAREPDAAAERLARCAYMPQRDLLLPWLDAAANAALAQRNRGVARSEARERATGLLTRFGLEGFERSFPHELSGGMRQRVAFARTLLAEKPVLLLDEPFASLDALTRGELQEWLAAEIEREARTMLLVTHDVEEALYLADRAFVLSQRPARVVAEVAAPAPRRRPRHEAIADEAMVEARERALEALAGGSR